MKLKRHLLAVILLAPSAVGGTLPCATAPCDTQQVATSWNTFTRYYEAYFPVGVSGGTPYPLIVYLPGLALGYGYDSPNFLHLENTVLQSFADANHVAVLALAPTCNNETVLFAFCASGFGQWMWEGNFFDEYYDYSPDDLGFINNMISTATGSWGADRTRIMLLGASTGGIEANRFAQAYPANIVSVALFAGPLWAKASDDNSSPEAPSGPVNVYIAHGDADPVLPYCGGPTSDPWAGLSGINSASEDETFNYWATGLSCGASVPSTAICTDGGATSGVLTKLASGCTRGASVRFDDYPGAGHIIMTYEGLCAAWNFTFPSVPCQSQASTIATITSWPNPAVVNQAVAFIVTVTGTGATPTGTIMFKNGVNTLATIALSDGQAIFNRAFGTPGTRGITAVYSGDAYFSGNTSAVLLEGVGGYPTTATLTATSNSPAVDQSDNFTAQVSSTVGTPTGTVTFIKNGNVTLGTVPLIGGEAKLTNSFGAGTKAIIAVYSGDATFAPSSSQLLLIHVGGD